MTGRSVAAAIVVALLLTGCSDRGQPRPGPSRTDVTATSILGSTRSYCEVQGLRALIRQGEVTVDDLPRGFDRTVVDGTPRVVDFRRVPARGFAERLDTLFASPGLRDVDVDEGAVRDCLRDTTDADVERTQGGPGFRLLDRCGSGTAHRCFDLGAYGNLFCTVRQARAAIADGRLPVRDLPSWADRTPFDDTVRVVDFRDPPRTDLTGAQLTQQLLNALRTQDVLTDANALAERADCRRNLDQSSVAMSEGGWPRATS